MIEWFDALDFVSVSAYWPLSRTRDPDLPTLLCAGPPITPEQGHCWCLGGECVGEASLIAGVLLGADETMPDTLRQAFRDTGTAHILAVSGFNVTIVAAARRS